MTNTSYYNRRMSIIDIHIVGPARLIPLLITSSTTSQLLSCLLTSTTRGTGSTRCHDKGVGARTAWA